MTQPQTMLPAPASHKRDNEDAAAGVERSGLSRRDLPSGGRVVLAPIQSTTPYVQELRANHGLYRQWADDPDQALNRTDVIEGDPVVKASVRYLGLLAVGQCGKNWSCTTDHDELALTAAVIESGLRQAPGFLKARMALARAVTRGMALVHVAWEPRVCRLRPDMQPRQWMVPARFTVVDKRRLRLFRVEGRRDLAYWAIWEPGTDAYVLLEDRARNPAVPPGFAVQDFIWYRSEMSERSAGFGEGEGDQLFEIVGISQRCLQYRARLAERWAEPTFVYGLDVGMGVLTEATMGEAFKTPYQRAEDFHATMEKWRGRHSLTIPKHDELNIHEHGGPSAAALEDFLRHLDNLKRTDILLGGLMDDGGGGGNTFGDDGGAEARTDAVAFNAQFHRAGIEEACEEGLVWEFARRNATTLMQAGLQVPYRGEIGISFAAKRAGNADVLMKRLEVAGQRGLAVGKSWLHEELDIPEPKPGEAIAVAAPPPAVGPDGLPLPGGPPAAGGPPASPFQFARGYVPRPRQFTKDASGKWVTIGAVDHHGGTPVKLDGEGNITAGPRDLTGSNVKDVGRRRDADPKPRTRTALENTLLERIRANREAPALNSESGLSVDAWASESHAGATPEEIKEALANLVASGVVKTKKVMTQIGQDRYGNPPEPETVWILGDDAEAQA